MTKYGVLFVCTGNICRSPMAEGIFRHHVRAARLEDRFIIDSAGTHGYYVGDPPDRRTIEAARKRGYVLDDLRARRLCSSDFNEFDLILAMDSSHYDALRAQTPPGSRAKVGMFLDGEEATASADVPDPYYGGPQDFDEVLDLAERGVEDLLRHLRKELLL